jgi:hypothetical protein
MIAILGALPFLATLWLLVVLGAAILEESGSKIAAALKGQPAQQYGVPTPCVPRHSRTAAIEATRASAQWRAAA